MLTPENKKNIIIQHQKSAHDTGSTLVQIELFNARIRDLQAHFQTHRKDLHSLRGLIAIVNKRRKLLTYLKSRDVNAYLTMTKKSA